MVDAPAPRVCSPAGFAPVRRGDSLRRTLSIDVTWPEGRRGTPARYIGRGRDVWTDAAEAGPVVLGQAGFEAMVAQDRHVLALKADAPGAELAQLVGSRAGGGFRALVREALPEHFAQGSVLYLLLDDLSGTALVCGWAWSLWDPDWTAAVRAAMTDPELRKAFPDRTGICTGFAPGSSGFDPDTERSPTLTTALLNPADLEGWHDFPVSEGISMRRARRMDIWKDDGIRIEAAFQDSATTPAGGRGVVHEYVLRLRADPVTFVVTEIVAQPKVLPFAECPGAAANVGVLLGAPLMEARGIVLEKLRGTAGCTHLNDALRALADVPVLLRQFAEFQGSRRRCST